MAFGLGKKSESRSSRPLSMIFPDNVKLFSKKNRSILDRNVEGSGSRRSRQSLVIDSTPRNVQSTMPDQQASKSDKSTQAPGVPSRRPSAATTTTTASTAASSTSGPPGPQGPLAEQAKQSPAAASPPKEEPAPFLTLQFDDSHRRSLLDLSEHYSTTTEPHADKSSGGGDLSGAESHSRMDPGSKNLGRKDQEADASAADQNVSSLSADVLGNLSKDSLDLTDHNRVEKPQEEPQAKAPEKSPPVEIPAKSNDVPKNDVPKTPQTPNPIEAAEAALEGTPLPRAQTPEEEHAFEIFDVDKLNLSPDAGAGLASPPGVLSPPATNKSLLEESVSPPTGSLGDTSGETVEGGWSVKPRDTPVLFQLDEPLPAFAPATPQGETLLTPDRKIVLNRGVFIFDPCENPAAQTLTEDELFNPFD